MNGAAPPVCLGVIGGSGIYEIDWLAHPGWEQVVGPFGKPSDHLLFGDLEGTPLVFLPRHGRGHRIPPTEVNFRAHIDALKRAGGTSPPARSWWWISSSTAPSPARRASSAPGWWPTSRWRPRSAPAWATRSRLRCGRPARRAFVAAPTSSWRVPSFPAGQNRSSTGAGAAPWSG